MELAKASGVAVLIAVAIWQTCQAGQVTLDHSLGQTGQTLPGPNFSITADKGKTHGNNLFFSFGQFDLSESETATFSGPNNIENILSRVTGGNPSSIDGLIKSEIAGANFFFINPKGIVFGPHAQIDVGGSFSASTANYLKLADGARFAAALDADDSALSSVPVSAFGFIGNSPGSITVQQSSLIQPTGNAISIVGGDISMDGGVLQAPGGRINVVSVKSEGEVPLDVTSLNVAEFKSVFPQQGQIELKNGAQVDVSGEGGGRVVIRGGTLTVDDSTIQANTTGATDGQGIDIAVVDDLNLVNGGQINTASTLGQGAGGNIDLTAASIRVDGQGVVGDDGFSPKTQISATTGDMFFGGESGKGGDIVIKTGSLEILNSAQISSATFGSGDAGRIDIEASSVRVDALFATLTQISANTQQIKGGGKAGDIVIRTDTIDIENGATILATTFGSGDAGLIDITATSVNLANFGVITPATFGTGNGGSVQITADSVQLDLSFIQAVTTSDATTGTGGNIHITTDSLDIRNGSQVSATTSGSGDGGEINLTANSIRLTGDDGASGLPTGISAASGDPFSGFVGTGNGGNIVIDTGSLEVSGGARISTSTIGPGNGGTVDLTADSILLTGDGGVSGSFTGIAAASGDPIFGIVGTGDGGNVVIRSSSLEVLFGAQVSAATIGPGNAGTIDVTASTLRLDGQGATAFTGISGFTSGSGSGGSVVIHAGEMEILSGGQVDASTLSFGNAGDISITADSLLMDGSGGNHLTLIDSGATIESQGGNGGHITLDVENSLEIRNDARITTSTFSLGNAGNIDITADQILLDGQGQALNTGIFAASIFNPLAPFIPIGAGGSIKVQANDLRILGGATISSDSLSSGRGGSIEVQANHLTLDRQGADFSQGVVPLALELLGSASFDFDVDDDGDVDAVDLALILGPQLFGRLLSGQGGEISAETFGIANSGMVSVQAGSLTLLNGAKITATTVGEGNGGDIEVSANDVALHDASSIQCAALASGDAGSVAVHVDDSLLLRGNSSLSVSSVASDGGSINVTAGSEIRVIESQITAEAAQNGGNISLVCPSLIYLFRSPLSANARQGDGGNISFDPSFVVLNESPITAKVDVQGNGGTVTINSDFFLASNSPFDVTTPSGIPGTVTVTAPNVDLSGSLVALPGSLLDAASRLQESCGARFAGEVSSFIVVGRGGMLPEQGGLLPSFELKGKVDGQ